MARLKLPPVSIFTYVLIATFAVSSWVDIVGLWVELPLMVNELPEKWSLPSFMALAIQLANIAPAMYSIGSKIHSMKNASSTSSHRKRDVVLSFIIISVEILSIFLLSFFWNKTVIIREKERSVALLALLCFCALCSCMSSLVYLPYMARFPVQYLSAYYIGNGLSGLIPGLTGLIQGLGGDPTCVNISLPFNESCIHHNCNNFSYQEYILKPQFPEPRFSIQVYLLIICGLLIMSLSAFYVLNYTDLKQYQMVTYNETAKKKTVYEVEEVENEQEGQQQLRDESIKDLIKSPSTKINNSTCQLAFHLTLVALLNAATNGILPSTQSYTCLPYGNVVYTLAIRLSSVVGPLASLSTMFLPKPGGKVLAGLTSLGLSIVAYHLILAFQSPHPILQHHISGSVLVVVSTLVMSACFSFVRVSVASVLHAYGGRKALIWCGGVTQVGSFCGAMLAFALINWTSLFTSIKPCSVPT